MKIKTKVVFMFLALLVILVSGCMEDKKKIVLDQPGNISSYEYEVFQDEWANQTPVNTTTYYLMEDKTKVQVVNIAVNTSKLQIYPPETLGGSSDDKPIENFVLLVDPSNETEADAQTFIELSHRNETSFINSSTNSSTNSSINSSTNSSTNSSINSSVNYTLTQEISQNMKVINLEFEEPVTGFIAYTLAIPGTQSLAFLKPDSEFIRVVLPKGYVTGNRVFGIARPTPSNVTFDEKGRQNLLWNSSKMGEREVAIQVKYYTESAPLYFLASIVILLFGVGLVLSRYFRSKKELESVKGIFELEKEYEKKQRKKK